MKNLVTLIAMITLSGCATLLDPWVYKINIQQGNVLEEEQVDTLEMGMTKEQVAFVLGTPIIKDTFNTDRWDYFYRLKTNKGKIIEDDLYVLFKDNKLVKIGGSFVDKQGAKQSQNENDAKSE